MLGSRAYAGALKHKQFPENGFLVCVIVVTRLPCVRMNTNTGKRVIKDEQHIGVIVVTRLPCVRMNTIVYYRMIVKMR